MTDNKINEQFGLSRDQQTPMKLEKTTAKITISTMKHTRCFQYINCSILGQKCMASKGDRNHSTIDNLISQTSHQVLK